MFEIAIFDSETTNIDNPEIIEAALVSITNIDNLATGGKYRQYFQPDGKISLGAMATHHIMDEDLVDCPPAASFHLPDETQYLIGHNVDFDWRVAGSPENVKRICTLALCRSLYPEADSHSLGAMMYLHCRDTAREMLKNAHSAMADVLMCREILLRILQDMPCRTIEELWEHSEAARVPKVMPFGKHKGLPISEIPADYRRWLLGQADVDPYLIKALSV